LKPFTHSKRIKPGLRSRRKNDTAPVPGSSFHGHGSGSRFGAVGFHESGFGSVALFSHGSRSSSGFCSFSHNNCLSLPQVKWKM